jgi:hypothetical protein
VALKAVGEVAVSCDFDGAFTSRNVTDFLYRCFATCGMTHPE